MKVLAIFGSPRKEGNTAQMMNAALSAFPKEAEIHRIYLGDLTIGRSGALGFTFTGIGNLDYDPLALRDAQGTGFRLVELYELIYEKK